MKAVILAAGKGERLGDITKKIPKPMIEIAGRPVLEHNILMCKRNGIDDIIINLHHLPFVIRNYFGNGEKFGVRISYSCEPKLLGTAGTIRSLSKDLRDSAFFVIYGDNYFDCDLDFEDLTQFHKAKKSDFTIALSQIDDVSQSGVADVAHNGRINRFIEKPTRAARARNYGNWINAGLYFLEPKVLERISEEYTDFGKDVIPFLVNSGNHVYGYKMKDGVKAVDTPQLLEDLINS